ncbi:isoleucine-tRNA ligase [Blastocladiella emersonii ATCC 22665]|nr:isoleucine-tRNA ligase [Blastocladiella emersonii ATCC 22665]
MKLLHTSSPILAAAASTAAAPAPAAGKAKEAKPKSEYADTLRLPKTSFAMRPDAAQRPVLLKRTTDELYAWQAAESPALRPEQFILHDGPPYANGDLHAGHALNKVLKDMVLRWQLLQGKRVHYVPGWDCHGLPIELKALQESAKAAKKAKKSTADAAAEPPLTPVAIRQKARELALATVEKQRADFQSFAIMGDWAKAYKTLEPAYVARQLRVFQKMVERGLIYRQRKPVYFSPATQTALAEAELEYHEHTSKSVYVKFAVTATGDASVPEGTNILIWTTTPWTLPANRAVAVHRDLSYVLVRVSPTEHWLVGADRLAALDFLPVDPAARDAAIVARFTGSDLLSWTYAHPFTGAACPVVAADYVTADSGTGLVHTAPGHGMDDYLTGMKHGLEIASPVDDYGKYTADAPAFLVGAPVLTDGTHRVIEYLQSTSALAHAHSFVHKYPYDWRAKKPVIQRATPQWFARIDAVRDTALAALRDAVTTVPDTGRSRLRSYVAGRSEWCISRQRSWGVPLPVLYHVETGDHLMTPESVAHIAAVIEANGGADAWWTLPVAAFLPPGSGLDPTQWRRGTDTMDVWFDSGTSWTLLGENTVADVYLEGSDQHRGWFQSSLLTSIATRGVAPYKKIITHGFLVDEHKQKMSKSIGNTVGPATIIHGGADKKAMPPVGVDGLRLWVGGAEYTRDISLGSKVLQATAESLRKIRNTCRYLLGNLDGFSRDTVVAYADLEDLDRYVLHELAAMADTVHAAYNAHQYYRVVQTLNVFTNNTLSAMYFESLKDRLYAEAADSPSRRAAQYTLAQILEFYVQSFAPILPLLAEEVYTHASPVLGSAHPGYFMGRTWRAAPAEWRAPSLAADLAPLLGLRDAANQVLERLRRDKRIRSSLEAELVLAAPHAATAAFLDTYKRAVQQLTVVSGVEVADANEVGGEEEYAVTLAPGDGNWDPAASAGGAKASVTVVARNAKKHKCPRCWNFWAPSEGALCGRCDAVVKQVGK